MDIHGLEKEPRQVKTSRTEVQDTQPSYLILVKFLKLSHLKITIVHKTLKASASTVQTKGIGAFFFLDSYVLHNSMCEINPLSLFTLIAQRNEKGSELFVKFFYRFP